MKSNCLQKLALLAFAVVMFASCTDTTSKGDPRKVMSGKDYLKVANIYDDIDDFSEGLSVVKKDEKYGMINKKGEEVIPCGYGYLGSCHDGMIKFFGLRAGFYMGKAGYLDREGNVVVDTIYDRARDFSEGLALVGNSVESSEDSWGTDYNYGFINTKGDVVIPITYEDAGDFSCGLAAVKVKDKENSQWGYVDKEGNFVIPCQYRGAQSFSEDLAFVKCKNGNEVVINTKGEVEFIVPKGYWNGGANFHDGLAVIHKGSWVENQEGYIDKEGKIAIDCIYYDASDFENGVARVQKEKDGDIFYINTKGEVVPKPEED